uniref:Glutathione reductase n=1 Tax=Eutreptiella gymnastica TaxID=73025 RepID=A0A7S1IQI1_9EUGL
MGDAPTASGSKMPAVALGAVFGLAAGLALLGTGAGPASLFSTPTATATTPTAVPLATFPGRSMAGAGPLYGSPVASSGFGGAGRPSADVQPVLMTTAAQGAQTSPSLHWAALAALSAAAFAIGTFLGRRPTHPATLPVPEQQQPQTLQEIAIAAYTSQHNYDYDLIVIGAGSGGVRASRISAGHGAKVALLEPSMAHGPPNYSAVGGTCVNVGCVPKKLMVYGSEYSHDFEDARAYGWDVPTGITHNWTRLMENKNKEISRLNGIYKNMLVNSGVNLLEGWGSLVDTHTVAVRSSRDSPEPDSTITAEKILIAVGGWPFIPDIPGKEHCISSNEAFYLPECPKRIVVVGGGYIATEFSCIFRGYGAQVTQMYRGSMFLNGFDDDLRTHLCGEMQAQGIEIMFNTNPAKIEKQADGSLLVTTEAGEQVPCDVCMYATGRKPYTRGLGLDKVGVEVNPKSGAIMVDEYSKTSVDGIYCVGDATNRINLTPVALHEGHCFADTEYGGMNRKPDHENVAAAVFSNPPLGTVGITEAEAAASYDRVAVFKSGFRPMVHTLTGSSTRVVMKLIVDVATDKVLGVHMCGPEAAEILQGMAVAVKMGATKHDFDSTIGIHPSAAEEFVTMRSPSYFIVKGEKMDKLP